MLSAPVREAKARLIEYLRRPLEERRQRRPPIDFEIFELAELKAALRKTFDDKCAICESRVDLTHLQARTYRPIQAAAPESGPNKAEYYSWLCYEWSNLPIICDACDKSRDHAFPVYNRRANYLANEHDLDEQEEPLLLNPTRDDPRRHLEFLADGSVTHRTERGAVPLARSISTDRSCGTPGRLQSTHSSRCWVSS